MSAGQVAIATASDGEFPAIGAVIEAAFGQADERRIFEDLFADDDLFLSLVARGEEGILGHLAAFRIDVAGPDDRPVAGIAPASVHPHCQRQGIGSALMKEAVARLRTMGLSRVFILGDPDYYGRFGFSVDATAGFSAAFGGPAFQALELTPDGPSFGQLYYPSAFER